MNVVGPAHRRGGAAVRGEGKRTAVTTPPTTKAVADAARLAERTEPDLTADPTAPRDHGVERDDRRTLLRGNELMEVRRSNRADHRPAVITSKAASATQNDPASPTAIAAIVWTAPAASRSVVRFLQ